MTSSAPPSDAVLKAVGSIAPPGTPVTTPEVAERFDCSARTVYNRLNALVEDGVLETKKAGANSRVWWRPSGEHRQQLRETRARLTMEASAMDRLHELHTRLLDTDRLSEMLDEVVDATIEHQGADFGDVQLYDSETGALTIAAERGFTEPFLEHFATVDAEDDSAYGRALRDGERIVVEDVQSDPASEPHRSVAADAGFRAVQSTPIHDGDGDPLGVISTHFREPHRPSERELRLTDLYTRLAASLIERERTITDLQRTKKQLEIATTAGEVGLWTWEFDTDVVTADGFLAETYGMNPERATAGVPIDEFFESVHESDRDQVREKLREAVEETDVFEAEYRVRNANGDTRWVNSRAMVEYDGSEQARMTGALTDVTDRHRRERALRETERRLEAAMTVGSVGTWTWDVSEDEVISDAALADLFGIDPSAVKDGLPLDVFLESVHEDDRNRLEDAIENTLDTGEPFEIEYRLHRSEGTVKWVSARGEVEYDGNGDPALLPGAVVNITERKRARRQLEDVASELGRTNERLSEANELNLLVQDLTQSLIEQLTREEIEQATCETLAGAETYAAAAIGDIIRDEGTATLRADSGHDGSTDDALSATVLESEPARRAAETGEVEVLHDIGGGAAGPAEWVMEARAHGYRSVILIPLRYGESSYGVLALFTSRGGSYTARERTALRRLGEVIGHAINAVETKSRLLSEVVVELDFESRDPAFFFNRLSSDLDCTIRLDDCVPDADGDFVYYITVENATADDVRDVISGMTLVDGVRLVSGESEGRSVFEVSVGGPSIGRTLIDADARIATAVVKEGITRLTAEVGPKSDVRGIVETVSETHSNVEFTARHEASRSNPARTQEVFNDRLTEKQRAAVQAAYQAGFYSWPRGSTGEEVAESLGVSAPTFHQHIRKAHRRILSELVGVDEEGRNDGSE